VPEVAPPPPNILLVVPVGPNRPGLKEGTCAGVGNSVEGPPEVLGAELPNEKGFAEEAVVPKVAPPPPNILLVVPVGPNRPVVDGVAELRTVDAIGVEPKPPAPVADPKRDPLSVLPNMEPGGAVELLKMGKAPDVVVGVPNKLVPVPP
jgi:hypothetical protein